ncbi:MAG: hypothetical protein HZA17_05975 [Nitrospirae bacterium]|nr:hypothetical protein [Nitrospirota bacterium]
MVKKDIITLLEGDKYVELIETAGKDVKGLLRCLIGLAYDKETVICWRAISAVGIVSGEIAGKRPEVARNLAQRLLWMMRDESGNNPWSVPEMLGEIVRNSPELFADIAPIILSFHDEQMLRSGIFSAAVRMSERRPDLLALSDEFVGTYLHDEDPLVRVYAVKLAGLHYLRGLCPVIVKLRKDESRVKIYDYDKGDFTMVHAGEIAGEIYKRLCSEER